MCYSTGNFEWVFCHYGNMEVYGILKKKKIQLEFVEL